MRKPVEQIHRNIDWKNYLISVRQITFSAMLYAFLFACVGQIVPLLNEDVVF